LLHSILDKIILKFDPLQILRGYRKKLKDFPEYNNFKTRRIEKLISPLESNLNCKLDINFHNSQFNLHINKQIINNNLEGLIKKIEEKNYPCAINLENNLPIVNISETFIDSINNNSSHSVIKILSNILIILDSEYQAEIEKQFENIFIETKYVENIDILRLKVQMNYYTSISSFYEDVAYMFSKVNENISSLILNVKENQQTFHNYLSAIFIEIIKLMKGIRKTFNKYYDEDIQIVTSGNKLPKIMSSFKNIPMKKEYQKIQEYEHIFPEISKKKMQTNLKPSCNGDCCLVYEDLGPLNLEKGKWDSKCCDRENNLECHPSLCGCGDKCKNMSMGNNNSKKLEIDVVEKYSWGIDLYSYRNLIEFLPLNFSDEYKGENFIEKILIRKLSDLGENGHSIIKSLECLSQEKKSETSFLAQHLLEVFKISPCARKTASIAFSKGIGIFCQKEQGIKRNELISIYLGEIYPPWYWYEKQDLIKKNKLDKELPDFYNIMLERFKQDEKGYDLVMVDPNSKGNFASRMSHSCVPNCNTVLMCSNGEYSIGMFSTREIKCGEELTFDYNSVTEKEKEFQDAICLCSSFNCRGHYLIYSNSVLFTEVLSKYHSFLHRNAILLQACDPKFEKNKNQELLDSDVELLKEFSIGSSILESAPFWIKKWTALILRFVKLEARLLPTMLCSEINENSEARIKQIPIISEQTKVPKFDKKQKTKVNKEETSISLKEKFDFNKSNFIYPGLKHYKSSTRGKQSLDENKNLQQVVVTNIQEENQTDDEDIVLEPNKIENILVDDKVENQQGVLKEKEKFMNVSGITENRIQNIAITLDKVLHVLSLMKTDQTPLILLSQKEIYEYYWGKEDSIRSVLESKLKKIVDFNELFLARERILRVLNFLKSDTFITNKILSEDEYLDRNKKIRDGFRRTALNIKLISTYVKSSNIVFYEGLADILYLYASTQTYFKYNSIYESCYSETISIRRRDINTCQVGDLDAAIHKGEKSYDKLYIWGQLVGWYKQTV
jgi:hypothetical protein